MSDRVKSAAEMIQQQIQELDSIVTKASQDLNAVRGIENVKKWKQRTVHLMGEQLGQTDAQRFAAKVPGPSFSNDLQDELADEAEDYRTFLLSLIEELKKRGVEDQRAK